ncbi:MAG: hypothetical protein CBHOC_3268 [uncultured Caballeronia sp.]|nr:MAG: hypothetical protein CBHOC_3268 [uncultured Caballeronia sp.]
MRPDSTYPATKSRRTRIFPDVSRLSANWSDTFAVRQSCPASILCPATVREAGGWLSSVSLPTNAMRLAADWPHVDHTCITLCAAYRKIWKNRVRRLARSIQPVQPEEGSVRHSPEFGLLICDSNIRPSRLPCWDGACLGSGASVFRHSRGAKRIIRPLACSNGWPSCRPICCPPSTHRAGCIAILFTLLVNLERMVCNRFRDAGKRLLRDLAAAFPTRLLWLDFPDDGHASEVADPRTRVAPLREIANDT